MKLSIHRKTLEVMSSVRRSFFLPVVLILSVHICNDVRAQSESQNLFDFLLYPERSLLADFQIIPVVAIRNLNDFRQLSLNKKGEILFDNRLVALNELERVIGQANSKISNSIICINCNLENNPTNLPAVERLIDVLKVLKSAGIHKICFGQPRPWIRSTLNSINRPWGVSKEQTPPCSNLFTTISSADTSRLSPDLTIENAKYSRERDIMLTIKNIGTADFAKPFWISQTCTKTDLLTGHYAKGMMFNNDGIKIAINSAIEITIPRSHLVGCYEIVRFVIDPERTKANELRYDNNCLDFDMKKRK